MTQIYTVDQVLQALKHIQDPDLGSDLVSLGMIQNVVIQGAKVSLKVVLTTPACPVKEKFKKDIETSLLALKGIESVAIEMTAQVKGLGKSGNSSGVQGIPGVTHIIAVSSGKGGVGKSTVSVNLATALALEGASVGLLDADVYGPNIPTMMGITEQPKIEPGQKQGQKQGEKQDEKQGEDIFIPPVARFNGIEIKVMSMGFLVPHDQPLVWRGPMLHSVVSQFCHKVRWGQLDYLIVDMPPGTGDVQLSFAQLVPITGALLVTTPQEVSMQDVRKAYHMFEKVRVPVLGFVENMSYFKCDSCEKRHFPFGKDGGVLLAKKFKADLLAQLPMVPAVREGGDLGRPIVAETGLHAQAIENTFIEPFKELARKVAQRISILEIRNKTSGGIEIGQFN